MLHYRLSIWTHWPLPEAWLPLLAQAETVVEKSYNAVMQGGKDFGNSTDAVRFGITIFFLFAGLAALAFLYERKNLAEIRELKAENRSQREELKRIRDAHEARYDELRVACDKKCEGYLGTMNFAVQEMSQVKQILQNLGMLRRGEDHLQVTIPPPPQPLPSKGNFLPSRRRIQSRPRDEQLGDENPA